MNTDVSILIVSYNCADDIRLCLESLRKHVRSVEWEVLIRDNGSRDVEKLRALASDDVRIIEGLDNIGFGRANNEIAEMARSEFLICLNPDTIFREDVVGPLLDHLRNSPGCGACGPMLEFPDGSLQDCWGEPVGLLWEFAESHYLQGLLRRRAWSRRLSDKTGPWRVGFTSGACLCLSRSLWKKIGGYDPEFFLNHEDVEICDRIRDQGLSVDLLPKLRLIHAEGVTQRVDWRRYTFHRLQGRWIYQAHRYSGSALLLARFLWWDGLLLKLVIGSVFLRGNARSRLGGFRDAARWVLGISPT